MKTKAPAGEGYRSDISGLLWLATALFFTLALGSYNPLDPSFNSMGVLNEASNKCGYLGSFLSDILYQCFGFSAWVFVLWAVRKSMLCFQKKIAEHSTLKDVVFFALTLFVCASLLDLHQPDKKFFESHIYPGGILGKGVITISLPYLQSAGSMIVLWSLALVLFSFITGLELSTILKQLGLGLKKTCIYIGQISAFKALNLLHKILPQRLRALFLPSNLENSKNTLKPKAPFFLSWLKKRGSEEEAEENSALFSDIATAQEDYFFQEGDNRPENGGKSLTLSTQAGGPIQWKLPTPALLHTPSNIVSELSVEDNQADAKKLTNKLEQFSISGEITNIRSGPVITLFEFKPDDHIKVARITQMEDDLMIALKSKSIRIIAPIPGKDVVGIETAHAKRQVVYLKKLLEEPMFWDSDRHLPLVLGQQVDGESAIISLEKIPHLMVAGSTGSGKSVFVISFLSSLLFRHTPKTLRLLLVDPKQVDLSAFKGLPHLLSPPIRESKPAVLALQWCLNEMQKRYRSLARFHVRDLAGFNQRVQNLSETEKAQHQAVLESFEKPEDSYYFSPQPHICIVLEEFGDLMSSPERSRVESLVVRLAQMARACGMHLILSMQSPRKDVVTGLIKTNIPGRISFKVSSRIDSRIILDEGGAERLLSQGDMLYLGPGQARPNRYHGPYMTEKEVAHLVEFWKRQGPAPEPLIKFSAGFAGSAGGRGLRGEDIPWDPDQEEDQKYSEICNYVSDLKEISASHLQRKYGLGYPRAARMIDKLEEEGLVGPARGSKPREVLSHK